ncbi:MAG: L-2-amino-thiazoline-4-carboxylic acid hydrolase [Bryobacteraceae bacterium]|jgi:hypothetical protein
MDSENRRNFLTKALPACAVSCLGCSAASAQEAPPAKHKFQEPSGLTYEQVFRMAFQEGYIPTMKALAEDLGKDKLLEMLKSACSRTAARAGAERAGKAPKRDLAAFAAPLEQPGELTKHAVTYQIVEHTEQALEIKVTECLWAKTFREKDAADIGYAAICHPDFATAPAFNPKMKMVRTKTLMQGHDCCNHRWEMTG